nr:P-selectin [Ciona intestinalis]|eukprot:XP_002121394.1 P-selectin [Ciona intestinalis]
MGSRAWLGFLVIVTFIHVTHGLFCVTCTNAKNHSECDRIGKIQKCQKNEKSCMIEVRWISNQGRKLVSKGCKQINACKNNLDLKACIEERPNSQCYCCCETNICNRGDSRCFPEGDPRLAELNGNISPSNPNVRHDPASGACPTLRTVRFGTVRCSSSNRRGSRCTFTCRRNYFSNAEQMTLTCRSNGWSSNVPVCQPMGCTYRRLPHGYSFCSRGRFHQSVCRHYCRRGYTRVGSFTSTCSFNQQTYTGRWSTGLPVCQAGRRPNRPRNCPAIANLQNGRTICSRQFQPRSLCRFSCNSNYHLVGSQRIYCQQISLQMSRWSSRKPTCRVINKRCPATPRLANGRLSCTQSNRLGSVCTFNCDQHYAKRGINYISCTEVGQLAQWRGGELPTCRPINRCETVTLTNGMSTCSIGKEVGSVCDLTCAEGYRIRGVDQITCTADGSWSSTTTICTEVLCSVIPPSDNIEIACSNGRSIGSVCSFDCDEGYYRIGQDQTMCLVQTSSSAEWSAAAPTCLPPTTCPALDELPNGLIDCTNSSNVGSHCDFVCGETYVMDGPSSTVCGEVRFGYGQWSHPLPVCKETCYVLSDMGNVRASCPVNKVVGSTCTFSCPRDHELVGFATTTCTNSENNGPVWDKPTPTCQLIKCPELRPFTRGNYTCTNSNNARSRCSYTCGDDYILRPSTSQTIRCQSNKNWTHAPPCCARQCPASPKIDIVMVLDSSSSVTEPGWRKMINFVKTALGFYEMGPNSTSVSVFRYNAEIDEANKISFQYTQTYGKEQLLRRIGRLPYNGQGTRTGQALSYALHILTNEINRPDAVDVVLVLTDGKSQDAVKAPAEALRRNGVLTYAIAIQPERGVLNMNQLNDIAGTPHNLFLLRSGFSSFTEDFAREIRNSVCHDQDVCI